MIFKNGILILEDGRVFRYESHTLRDSNPTQDPIAHGSRFEEEDLIKDRTKRFYKLEDITEK